MGPRASSWPPRAVTGALTPREARELVRAGGVHRGRQRPRLASAGGWGDAGQQGRAGVGPRVRAGFRRGPRLEPGPRVWWAPRGPDDVLPADTPEPPEAARSPMSVDSATSADTTLDTTGDVTVEDVKDFLG